MTRCRAARAAAGEADVPSVADRELSQRRRSARRTAWVLALVVLVIYAGFYVLEAYR